MSSTIMELNPATKKNFHRGAICCCVFALAATSTSLYIAVFMACYWGQTTASRIGLAAFGVVSVLTAHFLHALNRRPSIVFRLICWTTWFACLGYAFYAHASFFLIIQDESGKHRIATAIGPSGTDRAGRDLVEILGDQGRLKSALAEQSEVRCRSSCALQRLNKVRLQAELDVLAAEAEAAKSRQVEMHHQEVKKDMLRTDPLAVRLGSWVAISSMQFEFALSVWAAFMLEAAGGVFWYLSFKPEFSVATSPATVRMPIATAGEHGATDAAGGSSAKSSNEVTTRSGESQVAYWAGDERVTDLINKFRDGRVRPSVKAVREYLECSQDTAAELTRQAKEELKKSQTEARLSPA